MVKKQPARPARPIASKRAAARRRPRANRAAIAVLETLLEQTVQEWSATFGIAAELRASGYDGTRLPIDAEGHLYRIVQEALNNVHKHASAREVVVSLDRNGARTTLTVRDDGTGIEQSAGSESRRGLGLVGMRERAALIGARFEILSLPGRGTTVLVELP